MYVCEYFWIKIVLAHVFLWGGIMGNVGIFSFHIYILLYYVLDLQKGKRY